LDGAGQISSQRVTIGSLTDNVLLDIFDFCQMDSDMSQPWHALVHVCRRWRYIVFASPRRLDLQLQCKATTPVKKMLYIWPSLPIAILDCKPTRLGGDNIIAALERHDRVCRINLSNLTTSLLERLSIVMQESFEALTYLDLAFFGLLAPALPDTFLGGCAPRLRTLSLWGIPFPAIPKLLSSAGDLVDLSIGYVPSAGYISPEAMATCLSSLTKLEFLSLNFASLRAYPDRENRNPPILQRAVVPCLTKLEFEGFSEYFEDLVARIETPAICSVTTSFFNQLVVDISQLVQFVDRTETLKSFNWAYLLFSDGLAKICLGQWDLPGGECSSNYPFLNIAIRCTGLDWQVGVLTQICNQFWPLLYGVELLEIEDEGIRSQDWQDVMDKTQWLEFFHPFIAVQSLRIMPGLDALIAPALQELTGDRAMEVLPVLDSLFLGVPQSWIPSTWQALGPFIHARQLSNRPVTLYRLEMERD
jgi:hypothetical protein